MPVTQLVRSSFPTRCSAIALVLILCSQPVFSAFGLDTAFGPGGRVMISFPDATTNYRSGGLRIFVQPSGRIVAAGAFTNNGPDGQFPGNAFVGLTSTGTLDGTFGNSGLVLDWDPIAFTPLSDMDVYPDGRSLRVSQFLSLSGTNLPKAVRLSVDGVPDTAFGTNADIGERNAIPIQASVREDGKILVLGRHDNYELIRLNADGTRDNGFGVNGRFIMNFGRIQNSPSFTTQMKLLSDGRILLAGNIDPGPLPAGHREFFLMRLSPEGHIDKSFGRQGVLRIAFGPERTGSVRNMLVQADGKILLVGSIFEQDHDVWMMRLNRNGKADSTFGNVGVVISDFSPGIDDIAWSAHVAADGKIRIAGEAAAPSQFLLARYSAGGVLEEQITTAFTAQHPTRARDLAIQPDGKILVIGSTRNPNAAINGDVFAIARYTE